MRQSNRLSLDEIDIRLIKELQTDSRQSMRSLSSKVGASTPTVASKIQRLLQNGAIKAFTVSLDSASFGLKDYVAEIRCQPRHQRSILHSMSELRHALLTQDSRVIGIFSGNDKDAALLYNKMCNVAGATSVSLTPVITYEFNHGKPDIESGAKLSSTCYYCRGDIGVSPVVEKIGGKNRYFCCTSCSKLYRERFISLQRDARTQAE